MEEEEVDINGGIEDGATQASIRAAWYGDEDEDMSWADEEPDEDLQGWRLKILMENEADGF